MIAITAVVKAIKGLGRVAVSDKAQQLQQLVDGATTYLSENNLTNVATIQTMNNSHEQDKSVAPRVNNHHTEPNSSTMDNQRITQTNGNEQAPSRVEEAHIPIARQKKRTLQSKPISVGTLTEGPPASRTQARRDTISAAESPLAIHTRSKTKAGMAAATTTI